MPMNQLLSTVILVAFVVTLVLAVGSYVAYKARERRIPRGSRPEDADAPVFFERVFPSGRSARAAGTDVNADPGATR